MPFDMQTRFLFDDGMKLYFFFCKLFFQYGNGLFNKGRIMNAAFRLAEDLNVSCVVFHDVDMFPQDDRNFYGCPPTPRHIGAFVSNLGYQ